MSGPASPSGTPSNIYACLSVFGLRSPTITLGITIASKFVDMLCDRAPSSDSDHILATQFSVRPCITEPQNGPFSGTVRITNATDISRKGFALEHLLARFLALKEECPDEAIDIDWIHSKLAVRKGEVNAILYVQFLHAPLPPTDQRTPCSHYRDATLAPTDRPDEGFCRTEVEVYLSANHFPHVGRIRSRGLAKGREFGNPDTFTINTESLQVKDALLMDSGVIFNLYVFGAFSVANSHSSVADSANDVFDVMFVATPHLHPCAPYEFVIKGAEGTPLDILREEIHYFLSTLSEDFPNVALTHSWIDGQFFRYDQTRTHDTSEAPFMTILHIRGILNDRDALVCFLADFVPVEGERPLLVCLNPVTQPIPSVSNVRHLPQLTPQRKPRALNARRAENPRGPPPSPRSQARRQRSRSPDQGPTLRDFWPSERYEAHPRRKP